MFRIFPFLLLILLLLPAYLAPIINGYLAKHLCSCYFVSRRQWREVLLHERFLWLFRLSKLRKNDVEKWVEVSLFGRHTRRAIYREKLGCALAGKSEVTPHPMYLPKVSSSELKVSDTSLPPSALSPWFRTVGHTYALLVLRQGEIIAEEYAHGMNAATPLAGWSMAKSVTNALVGLMVGQQRLKLEDKIPAELLCGKAGERAEITMNDLLRMQSGLKWQERYWWRSDVTEMLFDSEDVTHQISRQALVHEPGSHWQYASGTTNLISSWLRLLLGQDYHSFPYQALFTPLGMSSALMETDWQGNFVGSSYMLATARDWARFGQLYLQDGCWQGRRLLPEGWVSYTRTAAEHALLGEYGAHFWLNAGKNGKRLLPSVTSDVYFASGFGGQRVIIIPSKEVVIVRLGSGHFREPDFDSLLKTLQAYL
ncbi:MAG: serine hydrolase domain-containing protein [Cyclobacteriaceae bacterium]